jgi:hypothetical protein
MEAKAIRALGLCVVGVLCAATTMTGCGGSSSRKGGSASTVAASTSSSTPSPVTSSAASPTSTSSGTAVAITPAPTTLSSGSFKLLTYNVAGLPQALSSSSPQQNTPQISPKLNDYHVVLAQEDFWYHGLLEKDTTHPHRSTPLVGYSTFMNDGLNRFSIYPFLSMTRIKWSDCNGFTGGSNDCLASKGFSFAVHELAPGVEVHVYNLHADAGSGSGDIQARVDQFAQLQSWIQSFSPNAALIVAGDTNLKASKRPRDGQTLDDFLAATGTADVARTLGQVEMIDRVMFRSSTKLTLTPTLWRIADEFIDSSGGDLSDHPALQVTFTWDEQP